MRWTEVASAHWSALTRGGKPRPKTLRETCRTSWHGCTGERLQGQAPAAVIDSQSGRPATFSGRSFHGGQNPPGGGIEDFHDRQHQCDVESLLFALLRLATSVFPGCGGRPAPRKNGRLTLKARSGSIRPWKSPLPAPNSGPMPRRARKRFPISQESGRKSARAFLFGLKPTPFGPIAPKRCETIQQT